MKREILFRGKRLDNGEFIEGSLTVDCHGNCCIYHPLKVPIGGGFQYFDIDPETVGQYTGMTDKNGTKIFEGDIVRHIDTMRHVVEVVNSEVYFDTEMLEFGFRYSNELFHCQFNNEFEVIGNIYDNKELLK